jgi:hypothetical protein
MFLFYNSELLYRGKSYEMNFTGGGCLVMQHMNQSTNMSPRAIEFLVAETVWPLMDDKADVYLCP